MKNISRILFLSAIIAATTMACDDDDDKPSLSDSDKSFLINAHNTNQAEIDLGSLAAQRGENEAVSNFGSKMVNDHTPALNDLKAIADKKEVSTPNQIDNEHDQLKQRLSMLSGINFDTAYINAQVKDHQKAISLFQEEIATANDQDLKDYANKYLPHLTEHLSMALQVQATLMDEANNSDSGN